MQILQFFFLSIEKAIFKQFKFTVNHKSSGKIESVTMDVVAEENQEECLKIQDQASGEVQVSMEAKVSHCHLLAKHRAELESCDEELTFTFVGKIETARGFCM